MSNLIEEAVKEYLGRIDYPEGDGSDLYAAPVGHAYHSHHWLYRVDGDLDVTALAESIERAIRDGAVSHSN